MNRRHKLTVALGAAALVASFTSFAQQPAAPAGKVWRVGFFAANNRPMSIEAHHHGAFARGMRALGYVEGNNLQIEYRYAATYVDKIFKGRKPSELLVEQPTRLELFINGKTAATLGLKIPQTLLISADKVIE